MKPGRWLIYAAFACFLVLACLAAPALGAEGGEPNLAEAPIGTLFHWLNFLLVFGGLGYLIAKNGPAFFGGRAAAISAALAQAAAAKAEAERQLQQAEEKLQRLGQEVAELRAAAQRESAADAERIRAATREETEKIARAARAEIEAAERAARMELKAIAAREAVERAKALLRNQITAETQATLFRSFVNSLAGSAN